MSNYLKIEVAESPDAAPNYARDTPDVRAATIVKVVIVKNGTERGKPTVDFQLEDRQGGKFVAMLTGELVKALGTAVAAVEG